MNTKLVGVIIIVALLAAGGSVYAYNNIVNISNSEVHVTNSTVIIGDGNTIIGLSPTPSNYPVDSPRPSHSPSPTPKPQYQTVTFTWYLKPQYINNVSWLNQTWGTYTDYNPNSPYYQHNAPHYNESLSWTENYINFLASFKYTQSGRMDLWNIFISATINLDTGYTVWVGKYITTDIYCVPDYCYNYTILNMLELDPYNHQVIAYSNHPVIACDERGYTVTFN
jgi:hypothetical protein